MFETNTVYRCGGNVCLRQTLFMAVGGSVCLRQTLFIGVGGSVAREHPSLAHSPGIRERGASLDSFKSDVTILIISSLQISI